MKDGEVAYVFFFFFFVCCFVFVFYWFKKTQKYAVFSVFSCVLSFASLLIPMFLTFSNR